MAKCYLRSSRCPDSDYNIASSVACKKKNNLQWLLAGNCGGLLNLIGEFCIIKKIPAETMCTIQWLSSLNLEIYLPDLGHTSNLVVWFTGDMYETWKLRAGGHISMVSRRIPRNGWPTCGFSIWLKMSQLAGRTGWGKLTPGQIVFSWLGCNNMSAERSWTGTRYSV